MEPRRVSGRRDSAARRMDRPVDRPTAHPSDSLPSPSPLLRRAFVSDDRVRLGASLLTSLASIGYSQRSGLVGDQLLHAWLEPPITVAGCSTRPMTSRPLLRRRQCRRRDARRWLVPGTSRVLWAAQSLWPTGFPARSAREIRDRADAPSASSDTRLKITAGPGLASESYGGETRRTAGAETERMVEPRRYDTVEWAAVALSNPPPSALRWRALATGLRRVARSYGRWISACAVGAKRYSNLGQNFTGWARLSVPRDGGTTSRCGSREVLDREGNLYTANLRRPLKRTGTQLSRRTVEVLRAALHVSMAFAIGRGGNFPAAPDFRHDHGIAVSSISHRRESRHSGLAANQLPARTSSGVSASNFSGRADGLPAAQTSDRLDGRWPRCSRRTARVQHGRQWLFFAKWLSGIVAAESGSERHAFRG